MQYCTLPSKNPHSKFLQPKLSWGSADSFHFSSKSRFFLYISFGCWLKPKGFFSSILVFLIFPWRPPPCSMTDPASLNSLAFIVFLSSALLWEAVEIYSLPFLSLFCFVVSKSHKNCSWVKKRMKIKFPCHIIDNI